MKLTAIIAVFIVMSSVNADDRLEYDNPTNSRGARLSQLLHEFRHQHVPSPTDRMILFGSERRSFGGNARELNRFLEQIAKLPDARTINILFTGPEGNVLGEPLTAAAAQACADYDWRVQVIQGEVTVCIPLAKDIPFAQIAVPTTLTVEAGYGAPRIASVFAKLHMEEKQQQFEASREQ